MRLGLGGGGDVRKMTGGAVRRWSRMGWLRRWWERGFACSGGKGRGLGGWRIWLVSL